MGKQISHLMEESDIGSGEKNEAQKDIEREERSIPAPHVGHAQNGSQFPQVVEEQTYSEQRPSAEEQRPRHSAGHGSHEGRILQEGDHIARIATAEMPDHMFEAQVYVRLSREPEVAETYIPAGTFGTEAEAWAAAEERAKRAFAEREF
ncbi:MAG: hypothetical protein JWR25_43 [Noviherbaspirillum sp.]|nr:hypothetical protein [Noviherbaspirillum sp.]